MAKRKADKHCCEFLAKAMVLNDGTRGVFGQSGISGLSKPGKVKSFFMGYVLKSGGFGKPGCWMNFCPFCGVKIDPATIAEQMGRKP